MARLFGKIPLWRSAIVPIPAEQLTQERLESAQPIWIPNFGRFTFRADPFGIWQQGWLYVFVEAFDYRDSRGWIEVLTFDDKLQLVMTETALRQPWHLSYPCVFVADGEHWMLPEASASGELTLYKAERFPTQWRAEVKIPLERGAVDATPLFHNGKWWLFYALRKSGPERSYELRIAFADRLTGPWQPHPLNPVRVGLADCRPAGTPLASRAFLDLPVQDCRRTYGAAVRRLRIRTLDEQSFEASSELWLDPLARFAPFSDGLHTLTSAGDVTLVDFKRDDASLLARLYGSWAARR